MEDNNKLLMDIQMMLYRLYATCEAGIMYSAYGKSSIVDVEESLFELIRDQAKTAIDKIGDVS